MLLEITAPSLSFWRTFSPHLHTPDLLFSGKGANHTCHMLVHRPNLANHSLLVMNLNFDQSHLNFDQKFQFLSETESSWDCVTHGNVLETILQLLLLRFLRFPCFQKLLLVTPCPSSNKPGPAFDVEKCLDWGRRVI